MANNRHTFLNASDFEQALRALATRLDTLPVPLQSLWLPEDCPADLLPWLADSLSVDVWESDWPEAIKRQVIATSISTHRQKGTVLAVKQALAAIGIIAELTEWWQQQPKAEPHTFLLTAWVRDNLYPDEPSRLSPRLLTTLTQLLDAAKPVRSHYQLRLGVQCDQHLYVGGVMRCVVLDNRYCDAQYQPPPLASNISLQSTLQITTTL